MKNYLSALIILFFTMLVTSCQKEIDCDISQKLNGVWNWVESIGGIGGWTLTPESEHKTKTIKIENMTYREYENDSLVIQARYNFIIKPDTYYETHYFIELENGGEIAFNIIGSELKLYEQCFDCYHHTYKRKE